MLDQIAKHGNLDLNIQVQGDLHIDEHHTIEDTGIALGEAFALALGEKKGIARYGYLLPMDDCLAQVALDFQVEIGSFGMLNLKERRWVKCQQKCSVTSLNHFQMGLNAI